MHLSYFQPAGEGDEAEQTHCPVECGGSLDTNSMFMFYFNLLTGSLLNTLHQHRFSTCKKRNFLAMTPFLEQLYTNPKSNTSRKPQIE